MGQCHTFGRLFLFQCFSKEQLTKFQQHILVDLILYTNSTYTYVYIFSPKGLSIVKSQNSQMERGGGKYSHMYIVAFLFCAMKLQNMRSFSPVLWTGWCWPVLLVSLMQWNCCGPMGQSTTTMTVEDLLPFTGRWTEATPDSSSGSSKTVLTSI